MSDYDDWDDDNQDAGESNAVRELRKANKAKERQIKELTDALEQMKGAVRDRSVKDTIKAKGLSEKVAFLVPKDLTTSEEVEAWINDYADVFGAPAPQADEADSQPPSPELDALGRISQTQSTGQPYSGDADQLASLIQSARTPEELNKVLFGDMRGPQAI